MWGRVLQRLGAGVVFLRIGCPSCHPSNSVEASKNYITMMCVHNDLLRHVLHAVIGYCTSVVSGWRWSPVVGVCFQDVPAAAACSDIPHVNRFPSWSSYDTRLHRGNNIATEIFHRPLLLLAFASLAHFSREYSWLGWIAYRSSI